MKSHMQIAYEYTHKFCTKNIYLQQLEIIFAGWNIKFYVTWNFNTDILNLDI